MRQSEIDRLARKMCIDSLVELWDYTSKNAAKEFRDSPDALDRYRWGIRWAIENIPAPKAAKKGGKRGKK